ncbi:hypothetical protein QFC19_008664 [Naganishia cerealis]|uniref:Uncharacterized protein n=1 Tax=Naganishia cerealis TaxID=610337 RepID=A0ACC2V191_9TREE|nr:hypothetical protein QFC19_008664 [Naganishia cerealis]
MASRKRVSYSLAPPRTPPPALGLPPPANDAALRPSLSYRTFPPQQQQQQPHGDAHPTHCRGVTALALDTTTILRGHDAPRGILYTGGRDGLVASWEQGVPLVPAAAAATEGDVRQAGDSEPVRWERIGMTDDDDEDDEDGDEEYAFDAAASAERRGVSGGDTVPRRNVRNDASSTKWTVDKEAIQRDGALGVSPDPLLPRRDRVRTDSSTPPARPPAATDIQAVPAGPYGLGE